MLFFFSPSFDVLSTLCSFDRRTPLMKSVHTERPLAFIQRIKRPVLRDELRRLTLSCHSLLFWAVCLSPRLPLYIDVCHQQRGRGGGGGDRIHLLWGSLAATLHHACTYFKYRDISLYRDRYLYIERYIHISICIYIFAFVYYFVRNGICSNTQFWEIFFFRMRSLCFSDVKRSLARGLYIYIYFFFQYTVIFLQYWNCLFRLHFLHMELYNQRVVRWCRCTHVSPLTADHVMCRTKYPQFFGHKEKIILHSNSVFSAFQRASICHAYSPGVLSWENITITAFIQSLICKLKFYTVPTVFCIRNKGIHRERALLLSIDVNVYLNPHHECLFIVCVYLFQYSRWWGE